MHTNAIPVKILAELKEVEARGNARLDALEARLDAILARLDRPTAGPELEDPAPRPTSIKAKRPCP